MVSVSFLDFWSVIDVSPIFLAYLADVEIWVTGMNWGRKVEEKVFMVH